jgi:hypothetical protein
MVLLNATFYKNWVQYLKVYVRSLINLGLGLRERDLQEELLGRAKTLGKWWGLWRALGAFQRAQDFMQ